MTEIAKLLKLDIKSKTRRQTIKCIYTQLDNQIDSDVDKGVKVLQEIKKKVMTFLGPPESGEPHVEATDLLELEGHLEKAKEKEKRRTTRS